jgi:hypothetical protein
MLLIAYLAIEIELYMLDFRHRISNLIPSVYFQLLQLCYCYCLYSTCSLFLLLLLLHSLIAPERPLSLVPITSSEIYIQEKIPQTSVSLIVLQPSPLILRLYTYDTFGNLVF